MFENIFTVCLDCGHRDIFTPRITTCTKCGSGWREAGYNLEEIKETFFTNISKRPFDIWRYHELLPIMKPHPTITMFEGGTPLIKSVNLGMMLGLQNLYIKDERQNPTGSFKDRQASITVTTLKEAGITETVLASTGNVAISYSAYTSRAGIKLWAFLTSLVPVEKMREVAIYGTKVIKVTASYDQTKKIAKEFAENRQKGSYLDRGVQSIPAIEGMKTLAFEISEQLTRDCGPPENGNNIPWRVPDWYIQSVSGGMGPVGVIKGFDELKTMGITNKLPAVAAVQVDGCAPMVHAWENNLETPIPVTAPHTNIATLATGDPGKTYTLLKNRMVRGGGGTFESVTDDEAFRSIHILAKMEGLSMEPASAVAFAGLIKMVRSGKIKPTDFVVVNLTGHTFPVEKMILGNGWSVDVKIPSKPPGGVPEEGLLSALSRISPNRFSSIAIVDDNPDARMLIRRILQSQGDFTIFEAADGVEGVKLAREKKPDVMILDMMMPKMDGFTVIDTLKSDDNTSAISIIVVTAKDLTEDEKNRLRGRIHATMQKGEFLDNDLLDELNDLIE